VGNLRHLSRNIADSRAGPFQHHFVISNASVTMDGISTHRVTVGGVSAGIYYDRWQLLQAENEYNKVALHPATLDEYKQVLDHIPPGETH